MVSKGLPLPGVPGTLYLDGHVLCEFGQQSDQAVGLRLLAALLWDGNFILGCCHGWGCGGVGGGVGGFLVVVIFEEEIGMSQ